MTTTLELFWSCVSMVGLVVGIQLFIWATLDHEELRAAKINGATIMLARARIRGESLRVFLQLLGFLAAIVQVDTPPVTSRLGPVSAPWVGEITRYMGLGPSSLVLIVVSMTLLVWSIMSWRDRVKIIGALKAHE